MKEDKVINKEENEYNNTMIDIDSINVSSSFKLDNMLFLKEEYKDNYINNIAYNKSKETKIEYEEYIENLENIMNYSNIEWGIISEFDRYIIDNINDEYMLKAINEIYIKNFSNEEILIKILNAISEIEYSKVNPIGQTIAIASLSHTSIAVQQKAIEAFEKWNNENSLIILENINIEEKWLKKYVNKIIDNLKKEEKYA